MKDHVTIHPDKSNVVLLNSHNSVSKKNVSLDMGDKTVQFSSSTTHLGLLRSEVNENIINIEERISLARRTLYALINTGVHGSNGLNPRISYKIYQCYVIPRLLYGLEVLPLTQSQINILSNFNWTTSKDSSHYLPELQPVLYTFYWGFSRWKQSYTKDSEDCCTIFSSQTMKPCNNWPKDK